MDGFSLKIDIAEAYRYMGGRGAPEGPERQALEKAAALVLEKAKPRVVQRLCGLVRGSSLSLAGTCLSLEGKAAAALLHDSTQCVIFCATIGSEIERLTRKWMLTDVSFTAALDACASSAVESLCDALEAQISAEYTEKGFFLTDRFSPGYGDLPIAVQHDFCAALDTGRRIGVFVSESGLMIPRKSVTALIGLSKNPQKHRQAGCGECLMLEHCTFRESGVSCYGQIV